ncbi:hypothetical protein PIB30_047311 [Stylosanthes scabra]|uniref:GRF-type domain-containing protein n=1 Tax=Stylosanthes scabra TaxID=79078 RepID=A0ABU6ZFG7_9FABA|nr:hypothetical protein [Stylosanthes scabra]
MDFENMRGSLAWLLKARVGRDQVGAVEAHKGECYYICSHGQPPVLRVSGTKENPGRRFRGCVYYGVQEHCDFFQWADKEQAEADSEKAKMRKKVSSLKTELRACERRLKIAVFVGMLGWTLLFSCGCRIVVEDFIIKGCCE